MTGWIVLIIILIIVLYACVNAPKSNSYMRRPLERFILKGGDSACCKFGYSPHQYVLTGAPSDVFRPWYMTQ